MNKADFYIGIDKYAKWIGSLLKYGEPLYVPPRILLMTNPIEYEETFIEQAKQLNFVYNTITPEDGWPHLWQDSQMTDYSYHLFNGKVCVMVWFKERRQNAETDGVGKK